MGGSQRLVLPAKSGRTDVVVLSFLPSRLREGDELGFQLEILELRPERHFLDFACPRMW